MPRSILIFALLSMISFIFNAHAQDASVVVRISHADICFQGGCYPALIGNDTRTGVYPLAVLHVSSPGYGGDVLMYDSNQTMWYAIHRTYDYGPVHNRQRLYYNTTPQQRTVTAGCINVEPDVYEMIKDCCRNSTLKIEE